MFRKWAYIPALAALCMSPLFARDIFVTPSSESGTTINIFRTDPLTSQGTFTSPSGAFQVLRTASGKHYVISRGTADQVSIFEGTPPALTQTKRYNLPGPATAATVSPDGRYVVVLAESAYIFDTTTDPAGTPPGVLVGSIPSSVAISQDSSRAFILSPTTLRLSGVDLATGTVTSSQTTPGAGSEVAVAPNGLVYVTAPNALLEYDARSLTNTNTYSLNAFPSKLSFTPDGKGAALVNTNPATGSSLIYVDFARKAFVSAPPLENNATLVDVVATSNSTVYAISSTGRLYRSTVAAGNTSPLTLTLVNLPGLETGVEDIVASFEVPARYLFVTTLFGIYRVDQTGSTVGPVTVAPGDLSITAPPITTGATTLTALNETQSVAVGAATLPLVVRATDAAGNPIANVPITFTSNLAGATISNAMPATNNQGLAVAYVTPPASGTASIGVTATATGVSVPATFTVNVGSGGTGGTTGGLQVYIGSGQVIPQNSSTQFQEPLQVIFRDPTGRPVPGVNVTWTVDVGGTLTPTSSLTNENGIATANFISNVVLSGSFQTSRITASTGSESVTLYVTSLAGFGNSPGSLNAVTRQSNSFPIEGRSGQTLPGAIRYDVTSALGARLPFVGIRVKDAPLDATGRPVAQCRGGLQLSDAAGLASCDLVFGSFVGETQVTIIVGSAKEERYTLRILPGEATAIRAVQGSGLSGTPGQQINVVAEVNDASGNPIPGVDVQWEAVTPASVSLSNTSAQSDSSGRVSATATLGPSPGTAEVRVRSGNASVTFSINVNLPGGRLERVAGGDAQSAAVGQAFTNPIAVRVLSSQTGTEQPVNGAQVTFGVESGSVTLGSATATTNSQGIASVTVTAGNTTGPAVIRARLGNLAETFNLTVRGPGPNFTAASFFNAAGFQPGISPGSLAVINVSGIVPDLRGSTTPGVIGPLPTELEGVMVDFNGFAAPILAVSNVNGQESVNVQVPFEVSPGSATVTVRTSTRGTTTVPGVQILPIKPGVFEFIDSSGQRFATGVRPDGSYISSTNPARRGEIIRAFLSGLGQTTPATGTNRLGLANQNVVAPVIVGLNNEGVRVVSARLLPGVVGVYAVEFEVPATATPGPVRPFAVAVVGADGQLVFGNASAIPVQ